MTNSCKLSSSLSENDLSIKFCSCLVDAIIAAADISLEGVECYCLHEYVRTYGKGTM